MNLDSKSLEKELLPADLDLKEYKLNPVSSAENKNSETSEKDESAPAEKDLTLKSQPEDAAEDEEIKETNLSETDEVKVREDDPIFKELAEPKLPELPRANRARLQVQSPNRLYFYWSLKNNPFQTLQKTFGRRTGNYRLVAKLINQGNGAEEMRPIEFEGDCWFDADAGSKYRAEIGFYAPNRPYFRILFSNAEETPRKSPSRHRDYSPDFSINARKFADILKMSGFRQDALEVSLAGDDIDYADFAARSAFQRLIGKKSAAVDDAGELRFAMLALASGYTLEDLRLRLNPSVYAVLEENIENLSAEKTFTVLQETFEVGEEEFFEDEEVSAPTVFGASLINFSKNLKRRKKQVPRRILPKFEDISRKFETISSSNQMWF